MKAPAEMNGGGFFVYRHTDNPINFVPPPNTHTMRTIPLALAALLLVACGGNNGKNAERWASADEAANGGFQEQAAPASVGAPLPIDRKIIRTGDLRFAVDDLEAARATILQRVQTSGGHVEGDERGAWGRNSTVTLRVRIPADRFDAFVQEMQGLGELEHQSISATDVTSEWVDVEARIAAKRAVEKRYLELAAQAKNVQEMLEVERELGNVRAEVESMEARMKAMRDQVAMSTLTITCTKQKAITERFTPQFGVALVEGWNNLLRFAVGLTHLWPFVILVGVLLFWWRRRRVVKKK